MNNLSSVPFIRSDNSPIEVELLNDGRVMILKDALFNPSTQRFHDIKLVRTGWTLFGFDFGGAGKFTSITQDEARQIQMTYSIVLKTLKVRPDEAAFWGSSSYTSYFTGENAAATLESGKPFRSFITRMFMRDTPVVKTSYAYGVQKGDVLISKEDAAYYGRDKMTIHDAFYVGIWNRSQKGLGDSLLNDNPVEAKSPLDMLPGALSGSSDVPSQAGIDPTMMGNNSANTGGENDPHMPAKNSKERLSKESNVHGASSANEQVAALPSVPPYRAASTPLDLGYDFAPFIERKRRVVEHLDRSHPVPFSAFVDHNNEKKINEFLFRRMLGALNRLSLDPKANDEDANYMRGLFRHWFRAAYHYLEKNSKPGDGYWQILSDVSRDVKDKEKAQAKAKELYWRRYATEFWLTLIDHYPRNKMVIDALEKILSTETFLKKPWFWE